MEDRIEVKIAPNPKKVAKAAAKLIFKLITESKQKHFNIALSGGTTPSLLYRRLVKKFQNQIPWHIVHFWWGDERMVDSASPDSNFHMVWQSMLSKVPVDKAQIHTIEGGTNNDEAEALRYAAEIEQFVPIKNQLPCFDLILLGLGEDGHTASIFPDTLNLMESSSICAVVEHPVTAQKRITLTGKIINNASNILFLTTGESKAVVVSNIMNSRESAREYPAYYILPDHGKMVWIIDEAASAKI